jgi:hypothetical protein
VKIEKREREGEAEERKRKNCKTSRAIISLPIPLERTRTRPRPFVITSAQRKSRVDGFSSLSLCFYKHTHTSIVPYQLAAFYSSRGLRIILARPLLFTKNYLNTHPCPNHSFLRAEASTTKRPGLKVPVASPSNRPAIVFRAIHLPRPRY